MLVCNQRKREKLKALVERESARNAMIIQWTKKIIVEKQMADAHEALLTPLVKIEKQECKYIKFDQEYPSNTSYHLIPFGKFQEIIYHWQNTW
jgi:hypothetical protein